MRGPEVKGSLFGDTIQLLKIVSRWHIRNPGPRRFPTVCVLSPNFHIRRGNVSLSAASSEVPAPGLTRSPMSPRYGRFVSTFILTAKILWRLFGEEVEVDGVGNGFVAGVAGVEVVAGVGCGGEDGWVRGVLRGFVEVDEAVELVGGADPLVDGLAHGFAGG